MSRKSSGVGVEVDPETRLHVIRETTLTPLTGRQDVCIDRTIYSVLSYFDVVSGPS